MITLDAMSRSSGGVFPDPATGASSSSTTDLWTLFVPVPRLELPVELDAQPPILIVVCTCDK